MTVRRPTGYSPIAAQYEDDVLSGRIVAGELLKLAIERQISDLGYGHQRGLYFDTEAANAILDFTELINLSPDTPIKLAPWQAWKLHTFYGWKRKADGVRRFRKKYESVARKNGKTPLVAIEILYHLCVDGPFRAEAYVSATKESQAKICFDDAKAMLDYSPDIAAILNATAETIYNQDPDHNGKFTFLTSNPKTADGTRPSYACIDEYHEFDDDAMLTKLTTGMVHHKEPIFNIVTTRGTDLSKPCFQSEKKVYIPILKRLIQNDRTFVLIYSMDDEDQKAENWQNPDLWYKANPMFGHLLDIEEMKLDFADAQLKGGITLNNFRTLNTNSWVNAPAVWIKSEVWRKGDRPIDPHEVLGKPCYGGLDLAKRDDFCSFALYFPPSEDGELDRYLWWHWIPQDTLREREAKGIASIRDWVDAGWLTTTEGNVTDYDTILNTIRDQLALYNVKGIAYDQHNIGNLDLTLQSEGVEMHVFPQTMANFSGPTKEFKESALKGELMHGGNPVVAWQVSHAVEIADNNENVRLTKDSRRAKEKIDGLIAAVMARGLYNATARTDTGPSQYESQTLFSL